MQQYLQVVSSKAICSVALNGASLGRARTTNGSDRVKHDLALIVRHFFPQILVLDGIAPALQAGSMQSCLRYLPTRIQFDISYS